MKKVASPDEFFDHMALVLLRLPLPMRETRVLWTITEVALGCPAGPDTHRRYRRPARRLLGVERLSVHPAVGFVAWGEGGEREALGIAQATLAAHAHLIRCVDEHFMTHPPRGRIERFLLSRTKRLGAKIIGERTDSRTPYLLRSYLARLGRMFVAPHYFFRSDDATELHSHPWLVSASLILTRGYTEYRLLSSYWMQALAMLTLALPLPLACLLVQALGVRLPLWLACLVGLVYGVLAALAVPLPGGTPGTVVKRRLRPLQLNVLFSRSYHRVELTHGNPWTLFVAGPRLTAELDGDDWGFLNPGTRVYRTARECGVADDLPAGSAVWPKPATEPDRPVGLIPRETP